MKANEIIEFEKSLQNISSLYEYILAIIGVINPNKEDVKDCAELMLTTIELYNAQVNILCNFEQKEYKLSYEGLHYLRKIGKYADLLDSIMFEGDDDTTNPIYIIFCNETGEELKEKYAYYIGYGAIYTKILNHSNELTSTGFYENYLEYFHYLDFDEEDFAIPFPEEYMDTVFLALANSEGILTHSSSILYALLVTCQNIVDGMLKKTVFNMEEAYSQYTRSSDKIHQIEQEIKGQVERIRILPNSTNSKVWGPLLNDFHHLEKKLRVYSINYEYKIHAEKCILWSVLDKHSLRAFMETCESLCFTSSELEKYFRQAYIIIFVLNHIPNGEDRFFKDIECHDIKWFDLKVLFEWVYRVSYIVEQIKIESSQENENRDGIILQGPEIDETIVPEGSSVVGSSTEDETVIEDIVHELFDETAKYRAAVIIRWAVVYIMAIRFLKFCGQDVELIRMVTNSKKEENNAKRYLHDARTIVTQNELTKCYIEGYTLDPKRINLTPSGDNKLMGENTISKLPLCANMLYKYLKQKHPKYVIESEDTPSHT